MSDAKKLQQAVDQAYTLYHTFGGGQNADYIPFLANVPSQLAGVAIVTCEGDVYCAGDSDYRFALESISKVCTLALGWKMSVHRRCRTKLALIPPGFPLTQLLPWNCMAANRCRRWSMQGQSPRPA